MRDALQIGLVKEPKMQNGFRKARVRRSGRETVERHELNSHALDLGVKSWVPVGALWHFFGRLEAQSLVHGRF